MNAVTISCNELQNAIHLTIAAQDGGFSIEDIKNQVAARTGLTDMYEIETRCKSTIMVMTMSKMIEKDGETFFFRRPENTEKDAA